jgi:hypothetical protein
MVSSVFWKKHARAALSPGANKKLSCKSLYERFTWSCALRQTSAESYGLEASKVEERLGDLVPFLAKFVCFLQIVVFRQFWGLFHHFFWGNNISNCSIKHVITVRWYLISFNALNDSEMSTFEEFNRAVEASLYNKFTRYGKMTINFYHNEQFI